MFLRLLPLFVLGSSISYGALILPSSVTVAVPSGSNNAAGAGTFANPYTDDILLDSIVINTGGGTTQTLTATDDSFIVGISAVVRSGNSFVNAEFGDNDNGSDGNPTPFVAAGILSEGAPLTDAIRESIDPSIQNPSISAAVNSLSLSQGVDGEAGDYSFDVFFENGVTDNNSGVDNIPEILIFERGINSSLQLEAIIGGTEAAPILAPLVVEIASSAWANTGIHIDTIEIGAAQELGAAAVDLNDFGITTESLLGVRITSTNGTGADIPSILAVVEDQSQITNPIPEPDVLLLSLGGIALFFLFRKRY